MATVEIKGLQSVINRLNSLGKSIDTVADNSLHKSAYDIKREVEKNIQTVTAAYNGHTYKATDTGRLFRSIHVEKLGMCRYAIGTNVEYAPMVEYGTGSAGDPSVPHTAKVKWVYFNPTVGEFRTAYPQPPRPYMRPAFETKRSVVTMNMSRDLLRAAIESTGGTV